LLAATEQSAASYGMDDINPGDSSVANQQRCKIFFPRYYPIEVQAGILGKAIILIALELAV
jgi:hypothetical protein